ncbi:MAG: DUF58 domain-containing protein [Gammaproteobacteria bacterium]|nr:DUF58 domain-containing protein [Gammaproteobacteria bacterium]
MTRFENNEDSDSDGVSISVRQLIRLRRQAADLGLSPRRKILSAQAGGYVSAYRGRGMDFNEVRRYQPGDDIRNMDWRVTARTGNPHTKLFHEERERPVFLLVDQFPGMFFGTRGCFKSVRAAEAATLLAWAAAERGDRIGGIISSTGRHAELRPMGRERGVLRLVRTLVNGHGKAQREGVTLPGSLTSSLERLNHAARPGSLVFILSDLRGLDEEGERRLIRLSRHSDLVMVLIFDPLEADLPPSGVYRISDGRGFLTMDTGERELIREFHRRFRERRGHLEELCRRNEIHFMALSTDEPLAKTLHRGLRLRFSGHGQIGIKSA